MLTQFAYNAYFRDILKIHIVFLQFLNTLGPNLLNPEFDEIEHPLVNFTSLSLLTRLKFVNDKINKIPSRTKFIEH